MTAAQVGGAPTTYVYYLRKGDRYKIGYTAQLDDRMRALKPDALLAVELGGYALEAERQRQFEHLRIRGERTKDWFREGGDLVAHIAAIAAQPPTLESLRAPRRTATVAPSELAALTLDELGASVRTLNEMEKAFQENRDNLFVALRAEGFSWREIQAKTGISHVSVRRGVERAAHA